MNNNLFRYQGYIGGVCEGLGIGVEFQVFYGEFLLCFLPLQPFGFTLFFGYFLKNLFEKLHLNYYILINI